MRYRKDDGWGFIIGALFLIAIVALAVIGWIMNIRTLCHLDLSPVTGEVVVRIIGIFMAPIGAVAGWF